MAVRLGTGNLITRAWLTPSSQHFEWLVANLMSPERPFIPFRTLATGAQSVIIDYRSAVSRNAWLVVGTNFLQFSMQSDDARTFNSGGGGAPQYDSTTKTIPRHWNGRYGYLLQAGQTITRRFDRFTIPSQGTLDNSVYRIGGLFPVMLSAVPFDPAWEPEVGREDAAEFVGAGNWAEEMQTDDPITVLRLPLQAAVNLADVGAADSLRLWQELMHQVATAGIAVLSLSDTDPTQAWVVRRRTLQPRWKVGAGLATADYELAEIIGGAHAIYSNDELEDDDMTGTARIQRDSATQISLQRGRIPLNVSGVWTRRTIATPVTITNGGLAANTTYLVYALDSGGNTALELSTTAHATDTATGEEIKSLDATRTLVGAIRTNGASQFVNTAIARFVISWFNRKAHNGVVTFSANRSTTSTSNVELHTEGRIEFLCWGDDDVEAKSTLLSSHGTTGGRMDTSFGWDGAAAEFISVQAPTLNYRTSAAFSASRRLSEGYHYLTPMGAVDAGTGTWLAFTGIQVTIRG